MLTDLILGTAGHIDHGKTSLVKALTGVDTDRLPEEKRRGITIELGFAELVLDDGQGGGGGFRLGIVDVPGHERFVRNMLAGATGMDLAMLVVAADDSVKQQTREHLDILRMLNLEAGVIALTKCDLPDANWIELVEEEIRELVRGTFLAQAPIVRCSSVTGEGLDTLRRELLAAAQKVAASARQRQISGPFRLAIDRTFTMAGHGTVVTGSVASGRARPGDELMIEPGSIVARIRGVQQHDRTVEEIHRGQRAAINLAGVHHETIARGHELASPGYLIPSRRISVRLTALADLPRPLKSRSRARLHVGTAEIMASVVLLDADELKPGQAALAQLMLGASVVATWNQPFVLRSESPVMTIGGGRVLDPHAERLRRDDQSRLDALKELESNDPVVRAAAALYLFGLRPWKPTDLVRMAGIDDPESVISELRTRGEIVEVRASTTRTVWLARRTVADLAGRIESTLAKLHQQFPLNTMIDRSRLVNRFAYLDNPPLVDAVIERLVREKKMRVSDRGIALAGHGVQLSASEQKLVDEIVERFRTAGFQPPTVPELQKSVVKNQAAVPKLVELAAAEGHLVAVSGEFYLHRDVEARLREMLEAELSNGKGLTMSEIRERLETTRKYAVPICEYLDRIGFTRRDGDLRFLAAK
jgi:selenocysteine-specific elongation factor